MVIHPKGLGMASGWPFVYPLAERIKNMFEYNERTKKQLEWIHKHKVLSTIGGLSLLILIIVTVNGIVSSPSSPATQTQPTDNMKVGQEGFLRLPGVTDSTQIICLGSTQDEAGQIGKSLLAKDVLGIVEIPGAFCVGNGTKALLIDKSFPWRKVRITKGVNKVDSDKVGLSGWLPMEWVVAQ